MEAAFVQVVNDHAGILHKVCKLYGKDDEDRKDLYQEIVLQPWRAFPTFRHEARVTTWMYRIALNTAISSFRKQSRQPTQVGMQEGFDVSQPTGQSDVEEQKHQLYTAVERLSSVEKAIVLLYLDGNSYDEMAQIMGISPSNVGVKLNRIKRQLRRIVQADNT